MTATASNPIKAPIAGNIAEQYSGEAVTANNLNVNEENYKAIPIVSSEPLTAKEEANTTPIQTDRIYESTGDSYNFTNLPRASVQESFYEELGRKTEEHAKHLVNLARIDGHSSPIVGVPQVDYSSIGLGSKKDRFSVSDAPPMRAFRQSDLLKDLYDIYSMPVMTGRGHKQSVSFDMLIIDKATGAPLEGLALNDFFEKYSGPVAEEYALKQQALAS